MVKVKLRVPLSSAPRETSSPLANPLRSAPDYSDDEDPATPLREVATQEAGLEGSDAEELDEEDDEDQEADELDELDELEADDDPLSKAGSSSTPTIRRSITLKPRSSKGGATSSASPSVDGSASPLPGGKVVKRANTARMAQAQSLTVEELDALPAAKRRKTAKARGAAGPGRGWRKGLTKGQKPVYELPPAETTPASFGNTSNARPSPTTTAVKTEGTPTPSTILPKPKLAAPPAAFGESSSRPTNPSASVRPSGSAPGGSSSGAVASIKIVSGPGGHTFTGDLNAKAGTAKNPGFRYPPLPSSRAGPPVQPIARIPTSFQAVIPLERNARQPRRWVKGKREILSMGGRPWSIPVFYGGEDRGYEKKVDAPPAAASASATAGTGIAGAGGEKPASKAGTPSAAPTPVAATTAAASKAVSPVPTSTPTASTTQTNAAAKASGAGGGSPLPPPKHLNGLGNQAETNWRGQSPAFLFGGR
ncbi:uncharacterized protein UTRI_03198 [Ustilago trichophora]|uniref:Uncharacterized protein n=1 Tax=Ustilago trichophora TaxID=86804 RepID=A0A5C3E534_9BASI|nr:uncharacterized protein UTRI_03198 [Ustilago trichophora]